MKEYVVTHIVNKADGTASAPGTVYGTEAEARKAFYRLCGQAVDSEYLTDAVVLMTKDGFLLESKSFHHDQEG